MPLVFCADYILSETLLSTCYPNSYHLGGALITFLSRLEGV